MFLKKWKWKINPETKLTVDRSFSEHEAGRLERFHLKAIFTFYRGRIILRRKSI